MKASQEMSALGLIQIAGSFVGSMCVTASFGRSAVNASSGSETNDTKKMFGATKLNDKSKIKHYKHVKKNLSLWQRLITLFRCEDAFWRSYHRFDNYPCLCCSEHLPQVYPDLDPFSGHHLLHVLND